MLSTGEVCPAHREVALDWQEEQWAFMRAADCALKRDALAGWADFVGDLMPWSLIVNPATFDPMEMAGAPRGKLTARARARQRAAEARPIAKGAAPTRRASLGSRDQAPGRAEVSPRPPVTVLPAYQQENASLPRISPGTALRRLQFFVNRARETLGRPVEGFMAIEAGDAWGQLHGHGLLWLSGGLRGGDITGLSRFWRGYPLNGFIRLEAPRSIEDVIEYATKHTVKQLGDVVFSVGCGRLWYRDMAEGPLSIDSTGASEGSAYKRAAGGGEVRYAARP